VYVRKGLKVANPFDQNTYLEDVRALGKKEREHAISRSKKLVIRGCEVKLALLQGGGGSRKSVEWKCELAEGVWAVTGRCR
jgi:hypothetical protein